MAAPASNVRVLVVDDSLSFREAAHGLLDDTAGFEWIGEASRGEDAVEQTARLRPDLVLMDVRMPGIGGVEAARRIAARPSPSIVVLVTGADLPIDVPPATAADILPKHRLNPASLRQLWEHHHSDTAQRATTLPGAPD